jgi:outer membrane protein assembly factor BamB
MHHRMMRRLLMFLLILATATACADVRSGPLDEKGAARSSYSTRPALPGWPTYHKNAHRSGHVAKAPKGRLHRAWSKHLHGAVYGEPLLVKGVLVVATETNDVYGLRPRTGRVRWHVKLGTPQPLSGLPCGNIDPLGITGTPAYSAGTGSVYVAAETIGGHHTLWALNALTGVRRWHRSLDTQPRRSPKAEQQRAALLVTHGRVLTAFGGLFGDCDNYVGYVTSVATNGRGPTHSYAVPTARKAGMWATPGPVLGGNGNVYVASGNGAEVNGRWDRSDSVTELTPVTLHRRSIFSPRSWRQDNANDLDLGSMSPAVVRSVHRLVIAGKRGVVYLLRPRLGGIGSAVRHLAGCAAYGGAAVVRRTVLLPCRKENAIRALRVGRSSLHWRWTARGVYSSPVVAGTKVYAADANSGALVVLRLRDGKVVRRLAAGPMPHFPSQIVCGNWVFVPTLQGVVAFRGR